MISSRQPKWQEHDYSIWYVRTLWSDGTCGNAEPVSRWQSVMNCGDSTATEIDHEVMKLLKYSYDEAKRLLSENREALDKIAEFLIERETITGKEFMKIFREIKGESEPKEKPRIVENKVEEKETPKVVLAKNELND